MATRTGADNKTSFVDRRPIGLCASFQHVAAVVQGYGLDVSGDDLFPRVLEARVWIEPPQQILAHVKFLGELFLRSFVRQALQLGLFLQIAGDACVNGPATSLSEILYDVSGGSVLSERSAFQVSASILPEAARFLACWKAASAFR
jgi:hypothetical protein